MERGGIAVLALLDVGVGSLSTRAAREVVGWGFVVFSPMPTTALKVWEQ